MAPVPTARMNLYLFHFHRATMKYHQLMSAWNNCPFYVFAPNRLRARVSVNRCVFSCLSLIERVASRCLSTQANHRHRSNDRTLISIIALVCLNIRRYVIIQFTLAQNSGSQFKFRTRCCRRSPASNINETNINQIMYTHAFNYCTICKAHTRTATICCTALFTISLIFFVQ